MSFLDYDTKSHLLELIVKQWETIKCNLNTNIGPCGVSTVIKIQENRALFKIGAANCFSEAGLTLSLTALMILV